MAAIAASPISSELAGYTMAPQALFAPDVSDAAAATTDLGAAASGLTENLLQRARSQLNTMYHFGGTSPASGFDCSGFVGWVYHDVVRDPLPRMANDLYKIDAPRVSSAGLAPGDLMFYRITGGKVSHVTMYVGARQFIHATRQGQPLRIESMDMPYWRQRFAGAKRILGTPWLKAEFR